MASRRFLFATRYSLFAIRSRSMSATLLLVQTLNGLQFGVMDFINLAHGVQYMVGAYFAAAFVAWTGSFAAGLALALPAALAFGLLLEVVVFRHLYDRDHLDQVLATFGIILFLNQGVKAVWGAAPLLVPIPPALACSIQSTASPSSRPGLPSAACSTSSCTTPAPGCWCGPAPRTPPWSRRSASTSAACSWSCSASAPCSRALPVRWWRRSSRSSRAWATTS